MNSRVEGAGAQACWFVGSVYDETEDQTSRFIDKGIWENGYTDKYIDLVKSIKKGDRIAIKASYTRKNSLPFDNRRQTVSAMAIKAIGIVTENSGDGRNLKVAWTRNESIREWYFYTNRSTVWRVLPGDWATDALIGFTFENKQQDYDRFRNDPFWRERFGDVAPEQTRFSWTKFYEAIADKLLEYKNKRQELVNGINSIAAQVDVLSYLQDIYKDGTVGPFKDICPFTVMGIFNRGITNLNRKLIAKKLADFLGVTESVPDTFDGIPLLNNQKSWFYGYEKDRQIDDIDTLWTIFAEAIRFAESGESNVKSTFVIAYNEAIQRLGVGWNLTMGLYWIRPWTYPTLESQSRYYIEKQLSIKIGYNSPEKRCTADDYLNVSDLLITRFQEETYPVHSFPELSMAAWLYQDAVVSIPPASTDVGTQDTLFNDILESEIVAAPIESYSIMNILEDGCFMDREKLEVILKRLSTKKNVILQGPPGTGKTWLAKKLAYALIGQKNETKIRAVQFHPNLSYEDFIRGWRPAGDGKLALVDGPFLEIIKAAAKEPAMRHVIVIEEINRGNPAQIFGEMLTLMEVDKRTPSEALELCYKRFEDERVFIPANLYIIGTMNIADRSLAIVDFAFRRRFAFIDLEPTFGAPWRDWVQKRCNIDLEIITQIEQSMNFLNQTITADSELGSQFRIGHSYVTPPIGIPISDGREWFRHVVETEIGPLLDEYWFDALPKAKQAKALLLEKF